MQDASRIGHEHAARSRLKNGVSGRVWRAFLAFLCTAYPPASWMDNHKNPLQKAEWLRRGFEGLR